MNENEKYYPENIRELRIRTAITRSMMFLDERTKHMKKPYKFSYQQKMNDAYLEMLTLAIAANKAHGSKKTYQRKIDVQLDILRALIDTAVNPRNRLISPGLHEVWSKELNEIGCMLGAWIKSTK
jgi:hypothetical protein